MREIGIDIETYSSNDLLKGGVYRYVEAEDFTILLFAYCVDGGAVQCCDFARGEKLPAEILNALKDPTVVKTAFNAVFERVCISKYFGWELLDPAQWRCTMVAAARMGLPMSLGQCGEVLKLKEGKMEEGKALIKHFSTPNKGIRHRPEDDLVLWEKFKQYNIRDVEVEQQILSKVRVLEPAPFDEELYVIDQRINDRGVLLDRQMAENATHLDEEYKALLLEEAKELTGLNNPISTTQIRGYLEGLCGIKISTLNKKNIDDIEELIKHNPKALRVLELRRELSKTSTAKYRAMLDCVCTDGRMHGLLQFCGASRTGRWAGRLVQLQNLPQNHITDLDLARQLAKSADLEEFTLNFSEPTQVLSELIRTALIARPGCTFHVCDFSAIEARVIAWLAGEEWVLNVFRKGGDIYCATAGQMFHCNVEKHGENSHLRPKGKVAVLALGYQGGVAALKAMGGSRLGLSDIEMKDIVERWRRANPSIVRLWDVIGRAASYAIRYKESVTINRGIAFSYKWGCLLITLPSGRTLCYPRATTTIEYSRSWAKREVIEYEGMNQTTKRWERLRTYSGKLTENIVQAIARDILGYKILEAEAAGFNAVFHVHDELVTESGPHKFLQELEEIFSTPIAWCPDLPLKGEGYSTPYYKKD